MFLNCHSEDETIFFISVDNNIVKLYIFVEFPASAINY